MLLLPLCFACCPRYVTAWEALLYMYVSVVVGRHNERRIDNSSSTVQASTNKYSSTTATTQTSQQQQWDRWRKIPNLADTTCRLVLTGDCALTTMILSYCKRVHAAKPRTIGGCSISPVYARHGNDCLVMEAVAESGVNAVNCTHRRSLFRDTTCRRRYSSSVANKWVQRAVPCPG